MVIAKLPVALGVPLITPLELSVRPAGRLPPERVKVVGAGESVATRV